MTFYLFSALASQDSDGMCVRERVRGVCDIYHSQILSTSSGIVFGRAELPSSSEHRRRKHASASFLTAVSKSCRSIVPQNPKPYRARRATVCLYPRLTRPLYDASMSYLAAVCTAELFVRTNSRRSPKLVVSTANISPNKASMSHNNAQQQRLTGCSGCIVGVQRSDRKERTVCLAVNGA